MAYVEEIKKLISAHIKSLEDKSVNRPYFDNDLYNEIKDNIVLVAQIYALPEVDEEMRRQYYLTAVNEYLTNNPIDVDRASSLVKTGYETWLTKERIAKIKWNYSDRYFTQLERKGRAEKVVNEVKDSSIDILEKMGDPELSSFFSKGLVVGNIQSGKTENFNGVVNRSIDAGYRMVIVLSGIMEDLRYQTQKRLETDVVGFGVKDEKLNTSGVKGVGTITNFSPQGEMNIEQVNSITSHKADFNKALANAHFNVNFLNVLICKKNVGILKNLILWLHDNLPEGSSCHKIPLLIIDDEADNASLNNMGAKGRAYASKVNASIRALLGLFEKKTYLGYTATPFANVLQDRNEASEQGLVIKTKIGGEEVEREFSQVSNIFPDDFIVLLKSPTNYIGAKHLFETVEPLENVSGQKIPLIAPPIKDYIEEFPSRVWMQETGDIIGIQNCRTKHDFHESSLSSVFDSYAHYRASTRASARDDAFPKMLPKSLKDAAACFILSIAIREARRSKIQHSSMFNPHHTMLVHVSRFIPWQNRTKGLLEKHISELKQGLLGDNPAEDGSIYTYFESMWYKFYADILESIREHLPIDYKDTFMSPLPFGAIKSKLLDAAEDIEVKALNSCPPKDELRYEDRNPLKVIAVGGNRLSRGFTLEGLSINYFCRSTNYSDTLLQMGRWFGYRPGYLDCCKIFTTSESIESFDLTTRTIEELEGEFRKMEDKRKSPSNFVLRVRKHPGTLKVTRPSILKNSVAVKWSYQDHLVQTTKFTVRKDALVSAWERFQTNVVSGRTFIPGIHAGFIMSKKTTALDVVNIINGIQNLDEDTRNGLARFIRLCDQKRKLRNWTIAIKATGDAGKIPPESTGLPESVRMAIRRGPKKDPIYWPEFVEKRLFKASGRNANIISSGKDLSVLLTDDEITAAETKFRLEKKNEYLRKNKDWTEAKAEARARKVNVPENVYREKMSDDEGLLLIYFIDAEYVFRIHENDEDTTLRDIATAESIDLKIPLVGYALGIPPIEPDPGGEYLRGDYDISEGDEEVSDEDSEVPNDIGVEGEL